MRARAVFVGAGKVGGRSSNRRQMSGAHQRKSREDAAPEDAEVGGKKLPIFLRPLQRLMGRSPAVVRGLCIALTVYWVQELARYLGWSQ